MADKRIDELPFASSVTPDDVTVIVQAGITKRSSVAAFAASALTNQTFLTVNSEPSLLNARRLVAGSGLTFTDGGSGGMFTATLTASGVGAGTYNLSSITVDGLGRITSASSNTISATAPPAGFTIGGSPITSTGTLTFSLANDLAAVEALSSSGLATRTATDTWTTRNLTQPAAGIVITNPDGVAGNPTFSLANDLAALEGLGTSGLAVRTAVDTWTTRTITGTANEITATNGDGVAGNPTLSLPSALTFTGKTVTGGTFSSPTVSGAPAISGASITTSTWTGGTITAPTLTVRDNAFTVQDDADNTKQAVFQLSSITTGTTRTYTLPNISDRLASLNDATALSLALG